MRSWIIALVGMTAPLGSCRDENVRQPARSVVADAPAAPLVPTPEIPERVQQALAQTHAADGEVRVQSSGQFVIRPETPACFLNRSPGFDSSIVFERLGQDASVESGDRQRPFEQSKTCQNDPTALLSVGIRGNNADGSPYGLRAAVWQGNPMEGGAFWVGSVARRPGEYPQFNNARWLGDVIIIRRSIAYDFERLSEEFAQHSKGNGER